MAEVGSSLMELNFRSYESYRLTGKDPEAKSLKAGGEGDDRE